jgi:hypothetical protein
MQGPTVSERIKKVTRATQWQRVAAVTVNFNMSRS